MPDHPRGLITVAQPAIERGLTTELRWATASADRIEIAAVPGPDIGTVEAVGSRRVGPAADTTYSLRVSEHGGEWTVADSVTLQVIDTRGRFQSLLPLNATALERALEAAVAAPIDVPIRTLWSSADCPAHLLPYLAWALGVEDWDPDWPVAVKRAAVANAFQIHREKGTLAGLKRLLDTAGAEYEYTERPAGVPMTAKLAIFNSNAVYLPDIAPAINRVKRLSLDLDIELRAAVMGEIPVAGGLGAVTVIEISDWRPLHAV